MTRFTVTWLEDAQNELAELWLEANDRSAITSATHAIDRELAEDAASKGEDVSEGLRSLTVPPLRVIFAVSEDDRIVEVMQAKPSP